MTDQTEEPEIAEPPRLEAPPHIPGKDELLAQIEGDRATTQDADEIKALDARREAVEAAGDDHHAREVYASSVARYLEAVAAGSGPEGEQ